MDLLLLDKDFQICGLVDDFSSLIWNRNYYKCGDFSLQTNLSSYNQFKNAKYIYSKNFKETGIIEAFEKKYTSEGTKLLHSGRFLESILDDRCINETQYFKNMITEDIIRFLVDTYFIKDEIRKIPKIVLGERKNLGTVHTTQKTGGSVMDYIYELCKQDELSISLEYDFDNDQLVFNVWQGLDRLDTQDNNSWVIFSKNFENILEDTYSADNTQYKNFAYVVGESRKTDSSGNQTSKRVNVTVDRVKDGEDRKELYVDARDLQSDEDTTDEEYKQMLIERGIEKLNECNKVEEVELKININSNLIYGTDYDLGDKVVYKSEELGLIIENRIVGVSESYENGNRELDVTFGDEYNLKKIKEAIK